MGQRDLKTLSGLELMSVWLIHALQTVRGAELIPAESFRGLSPACYRILNLAALLPHALAHSTSHPSIEQAHPGCELRTSELPLQRVTRFIRFPRPPPPAGKRVLGAGAGRGSRSERAPDPSCPPREGSRGEVGKPHGNPSKREKEIFVFGD